MPGRSLLTVAPVTDLWGAEIKLLRGLRAGSWAVALTAPGPGALRDAAAPDVEWRRLALGRMGRHEGARAGLVATGSAAERWPRIWRRADVLLASSAAVARRLDGLSLHVVHPPVDPDPPDVAPPWEQDGRPVVGFVGRVEPDEGVLDLVRAAPAIRAASGARVVLLDGDGAGPRRGLPRHGSRQQRCRALRLGPWRRRADAPPRRAGAAFAPRVGRDRAGRGDGDRHSRW